MSDLVKYSPQATKLLKEKSNKTRARNLEVIRKGKLHLAELKLRKKNEQQKKTI